MFTQSNLYDAYDIDVMNNKLTKNNIVIIHFNGEKIPLSRPSIFGSWFDEAKDYKSITLDNMAFTTLLQKYIPPSTATFDAFSSLRYPDASDFISPPIFLPPISQEVRCCVSIKN